MKGEVMVTNSQKEALEKVFSTYENYVVMGCEGNPISYMRDVMNAVSKLAVMFPAISLKNDDLDIFKRIYFDYYKEKEKK